MGFPNADKAIQRLLVNRFSELQDDTAFTINDLFDDLEVDERQKIADYIARKSFISDIRERGDSYAYIMLSFPMIDMPMPQISVTVGNDEADRWLHDSTGIESIPVTDTNGDVVAWDITKGFYASSTINISVIATNKDEVIWLSRLCQRFIFESTEQLALQGIIELEVGMSDAQLNQDILPTPAMARQLRITCKTENTWKRRIPASVYATGINTHW